MAIRTGVDAKAPAPAGQEAVKGGGVIKWREGMEVTARFVQIKGITTQYGDSELLIMFDEESRTDITLGCPFQLSSKLRTVKPNALVTIRCLGKHASGARGNAAWQFDVFAAPGDVVEMEDGDIPF